MRVGLADTTFARADMAAWALEELSGVEVERYTVPGMKDLAVASKKLIEEHKCDIVIALGWVGKEKIDETCAHEANVALQQAELMTSTHILKVFFHESEGGDMVKVAEDRVRKHARNALALLKGKTELSKNAGQGKRQGYDDASTLQKH
ncbi:MAG: riboflavin synthase [Candidatus Woesearchaeota archaeon]|nr:riboflavin synthase [Candidatus Woesearchaeota archaeon]